MTVDGQDAPPDGVPAGGKRRQRHLQQTSILRVYPWIAAVDGAAISVEYMNLAEPMLQLAIEPDPNLLRCGGQGCAGAALGPLWECVVGRRCRAADHDGSRKDSSTGPREQTVCPESVNGVVVGEAGRALEPILTTGEVPISGQRAGVLDAETCRLAGSVAMCWCPGGFGVSSAACGTARR